MAGKTSPSIIDVTIDRAYQIAEELKNRTEHSTSAITVFTGEHDNFGHIHVVIPPLGDATLLPVVIQSFEL
jgi:hypothetical protein